MTLIIGNVFAQEFQSPKETFTNTIGMQFVLIPKGTFTMGSPKNQKVRSEIEVEHQVTLSKDFFLCITEVTQAQYEVVTGKNPSFFQGDKLNGDNRQNPVEQVTWTEAVEFCRLLSELPEEKKAGRVYRLPTEAEWEYACRAGSKTAYSFGDSEKMLADYGWYIGNNMGKTHPVGEKKPNDWGLYDMHGNAWEWCSDWFDHDPQGPATDPIGPATGSQRAFRGGFWLNRAPFCRSACRLSFEPSKRNRMLGFRVALTVPEIKK